MWVLAVASRRQAWYLAKYPRVEARFLEELDSILSRHDASIIDISLLKELSVYTFLVCRQVEDGMVWVG